MIICGYKFKRISEIVRLAGIYFYLFEDVEKFNIRGDNF